MIKVYIESTDYLDDEVLFESEYQRVFDYRRQRIDKVKKPEERKRLLAVELLLMKALGEFGVDYNGELNFNEHGKPYLKDYPEVFFNLSHAGNRVMVVVGDSEVGCDVERSGRVSQKIAERYFSKGELGQIAALVSEDKKVQFRTKIWCLKESYGKMIGKGLAGSLGCTDFDIAIIQKSGRCDGCAECGVWEENGYVYAYCKQG